MRVLIEHLDFLPDTRPLDQHITGLPASAGSGHLVHGHEVLLILRLVGFVHLEVRLQYELIDHGMATKHIPLEFQPLAPTHAHVILLPLLQGH